MNMSKDPSLYAGVSADLRADARLQNCKLAMTLLRAGLEPASQKLMSSFSTDELETI